MAKYADGHLPDFDYENRTMISLKEDEETHVLVEFEMVSIRRHSKMIDFGIQMMGTSSSEQDEPGVYIVQPPKETTSIQTLGSLRPGDQVLNVNGCPVKSVYQANEILKLPRENADFLVLRRCRNLNISKVQCNSLEKCTDNLNSKMHCEMQPQTVYVSPDKLAGMVRFQQSLLEAKLKQSPITILSNNSRSSSPFTKRLVPFTSTSSPSNHTPAQLVEKKNETDDQLFKWVIRRRIDGTRYLSKRSRKNDVNIARSASISSQKLNEAYSRSNSHDPLIASSKILHSDSEVLKNGRSLSTRTLKDKGSDVSCKPHFSFDDYKRMSSVNPPYNRHLTKISDKQVVNETSSEIMYHPRPPLLFKNRNPSTRKFIIEEETEERNGVMNKVAKAHTTKGILQKKLNQTLLSVTTI